MILVLDLGNTNLYIGVYENDSLVYEFRKHTEINRSSDEYYQFIKECLINKNISLNAFKGAILSSVVPSLTSIIKNAVESLLNVECLLIGKGIKTGLPIKIDNPNELGADLVCDCVGAINKYQVPLIVVDLGTANKILVVNDKKEFIGCTISVGLHIGLKSLTKNAAQLMDVNLTTPSKVIGKNSIDSLNSGAIYGTCAMIEGMASKIEKELNIKCNKIITGGNARFITDIIDEEFVYDPTLILDGLYKIYCKNK